MVDSVFIILISNDQCRRGVHHYPNYKVSTWKLAITSTLEKAEYLMREYLEKTDPELIHSIKINEIPLDRHCPGDACLSSYLYDYEGNRIDERTFSTIMEDNGIYPGRTPEQIRFKNGDIVEVMNGEEIELGFVVGVPPDPEWAERFNNYVGIHMDDTDDSYTILFGSNFAYHEHADSLFVFKPRYKVHPLVQKRLEKAYNDYVTYPARVEILNTTAKAQLNDFFAKHGIEGCADGLIYDFDDDFRVSLYLSSGPLCICISRSKVFHHIDRVCCTLARLAGVPVNGKGYRVRKHEKGIAGIVYI